MLSRESVPGSTLAPVATIDCPSRRRDSFYKRTPFSAQKPARLYHDPDPAGKVLLSLSTWQTTALGRIAPGTNFTEIVTERMSFPPSTSRVQRRRVRVTAAITSSVRVIVSTRYWPKAFEPRSNLAITKSVVYASALLREGVCRL